MTEEKEFKIEESEEKDWYNLTFREPIIFNKGLLTEISLNKFKFPKSYIERALIDYFNE